MGLPKRRVVTLCDKICQAKTYILVRVCCCHTLLEGWGAKQYPLDFWKDFVIKVIQNVVEKMVILLKKICGSMVYRYERRVHLKNIVLPPPGNT